MSSGSNAYKNGCHGKSGGASIATNYTVDGKGCPLQTTPNTQMQVAPNSQTQAIVYVVVILVLYFSIMFVLIFRYLRKERNQFQLPYLRSSLLLKKDRYSRCGRDVEISHLSTVSTQMMMEKEAVASQPTSALLPTATNMDTAV